jgi:hypothetical protein
VYATAVHSDCMRYNVARLVQDPCPEIQTSFVLTLSFLVCGIFGTFMTGGCVRACADPHIFHLGTKLEVNGQLLGGPQSRSG